MVDASGSYYEDVIDNDILTEVSEEETSVEPEGEVQTADSVPENEPEVSEETPSMEETEDVEVDPYSKEYFQPGTFENSEKELEWYRDRLDTIRQVLDTNSDLYTGYVNQHTAALVEKVSGEIEGFKVMHEALQSDAKGFLLQFIPEALAEHGINPIMNEDEILIRVEQDMIKEFGDNYHMRTNQGELFNPRSFTAKVWAKQQSLTREWDMINNRNKEILQSWNDNIVAKRNQQTETAVQTAAEPVNMDAAYDQYFKGKGYDRPSFDHLMTQAQQKTMTFEDLEKILRFDDFLKGAYEKGKREASQMRYNEAKKEGTEYSVKRNSVMEQATPESIHDDFYSVFANGGIPNY